MASSLNHFNMLQIIFLFYFLFTLTCSGSSLSHDEECSALNQFKQSIFHQDDEFCTASWVQTFHSWKPTNSNASDARFDCCSWYGVECSNDHEYGHVVGLDLSVSFLCGHINSTSTLFSLIHLRSLNLAINNFGESQIPSEIAHLKQLRSLNLSQSGFSGQVPSEISQLMHLSSLDLSKNTLELQSPNGLKNLVQNLTGLEQLHLSGVAISSSVPHFLANLSSLRSIVLQDCSLQNEFPVAILELPKLRILNVALNTNLTGSFHEFHNNSLLEYVNLGLTGFFGIIPESISNLNHLTFLRLSECSFTGRIPSALSNLTQLKALGLGNNEFTSLVPSLVSLSQLNILELSGNEFQKRQLPNWLGKLTKLTDLYLYDMNINGEIPHFLANLTKLGVVAMGRNFLTGHIPSWFFNLTQLRALDVQQNQLHGPITSSFSKLKSTLQDLTLSDNKFSGRVDLDMFVGFHKLENLVLDNNMLSVVATNNYTNTTLPELRFLGLSECNLKEFPALLRFQSKLEILFLNNNEIDGLLPVWIWNYSQETLQVISLVGNSITGEIPPSICEVKSLLQLHLSFNNMSGPIPPCLGSLRSLVVLNLKNNNFHGIMMNAFMHGSMLRNIDLSENGFMGQLPRSLTNCTNLEVLSLGDNTFHDVFPFWLGTLAKLQVLVLRSNKLYGPIQGSTTLCSQFPKLRIIDLSNNGFGSQLHQKYFQTCNAMRSVYDGESSVMGSEMSFESFSASSTYSMTLIHKGIRTEYQKILTIFTAIDLSSNEFEGEIPLSLQDLQGLESLNLSNNHFSGHVLPSLGYLKKLESLDLSQNDLSGEIPQELMQLNFLSIFNVSFNNLDGRILHGGQFNTFENNSYMGNPRLCGDPLSKECQGSKVSTLPPARNMSESESLLPRERTDWIIVFCGVGSGLVVGVVIGSFLYERYSDRFTKMKDRWVRPLRNTRRNQGGVMASSLKGKEKV